jgi:hypothetical protein
MSHDPELTQDEAQLFALMRDGVITSIVYTPKVVRSAHNSSFVATDIWTVQASFPSSPGAQLYSSSVSALDAYMKAFSDIMTRKLEGKEIYTPQVLKRRAKLNL